MSGRLIVGVNERAESEDAIALGKLLARLRGAGLTLVAVFPYEPLPIGVDAYERAMEKDSAALFERLLPRTEGVEVETRAFGGGSPARTLNDLAEAEEASAIVLGSTHRGTLGRVVPGSVGERLLSGAPCPVAIAPRGYSERADGSVRTIAVAYDGEAESKAALELARELAVSEHASLRLLTVVEPHGTIEQFAELVGAMTEQYRARMDEALAALPPETKPEGRLIGGPGEELRVTDPGSVLAAEAEGADLLVIGSRGYGPVRRVLLGGVSATVMREARCPVLVVPRHAGGA